MKLLTKHLGFLLLGAVLFASPAKADLVSVTLDVPTNFSFDETNVDVVDDVSGYKIGINLPVLPGLAIENYTVTTKGDVVLDFALYDVYVDLPIPVINISLGVGIGKVTLPQEEIESADVSQVFLELGWPIFGVADIHLGYHQISGDLKAPSGEEISLDSTLTTIGFKVGF